jgi:hypothetical protein
MPYCSALEVVSIRTWLIVQILLWALTVVLVYRVGAVLFNELTGLFAGGMTALTWEMFRFALRPQSDAMLLFALAVALWALAVDYVSPSRRSAIFVAVSLLFMAISRPLGVPIVFGVLVWKLRPLDAETTLDPRDASFSRIALLAGLALVAVVILVIYFVPRLTRPAPTSAIGWRSGLAGAWWHGIIVTHTTDPTFQYLYQPQQASSMGMWIVLNIDHIVSMGLLRVAAFFIPVLPRWSTFHIVVNAVTVFPLVVGTALGVRTLLSQARYRLAGLLVAPIITSLITVGIIYVDGGFNYRAPATLSFALLSAYWLRETLRGTAVERFLSETVPF